MQLALTLGVTGRSLGKSSMTNDQKSLKNVLSTLETVVYKVEVLIIENLYGHFHLAL